MKLQAISILRLKRSFIYRPAAAILALLLLPVFSRFEGDTAVRAFQASAGVIGGSNAIIQNYCVGTSCYISDLGQLERDAVAGYLGLHNLPSADTDIIYKYGRADLRNAIRGVIFNILQGIIDTPADKRLSHEQNLYNWFQSLVQQNEIDQYKLAIAQYHSWQRDPCLFTLDPVIASEYKLSYNGAPFCGRQFANLFLLPDVPDQTYFTAFGLKNSYGSPASTFPYFGSLVADTGINAAAVAGISAGTAALVISGAAAVLAKSLTLALAAVTATSHALAGSSPLFVLSGSTVAALTPAFIVGGAVVIVLAFIAIGVAAGIRVFNNQKNIDQLNNLTNTLDLVTRTPPDLSAFQSDTSGLGMYKLQTAMDGQTVPDVPSTALLPAHSDSDLNFAIQKSTEPITLVGDTLAYLDWKGAEWSAQTYRGWFVQTCKGSQCTQADSINANIRYVDWSGVNWTAARLGDKFISTKNKPASTDKDCSADPATGVSTGPDFSKCISYLSTSIPLKAPGGVLERVSLSVSKPSMPPVFTGEPTLPFTPGMPSSQTITASGNPAPQICFSSSNPPLPADFSLKEGVCGQNGRLQLTFDGNPGSPEQVYQLTLAATNGTTAQPVLKTFAIDVSHHVEITSPPVLSGTAGFPVDFTVTTTGSPTPSLSVSPELLDRFPGLNFKDNGDGTGTFSGSPIRPGNAFCPIINGKPACGITASNSRETVVQAFAIDLAPAPAASLGPPSNATFIAGAANSVPITSTSARTHVFWNFKSKTSWLVLVDNGNGTATLFGHPPAGTTGTFTVEIAPIAFGSAAYITPVFSPFPVTVVNKPTFLSPNTAAFTVGSRGSFAISASEGNIDKIFGRLPPGLSFTAGNPATISGIPAPGSGGQYPLEVTNSVPNQVSIYGNLGLNIYQAPAIISPKNATFTTGLPNSFTVTTSSFPNVSARPVTQPLTPPTNPNEGKGMYFAVTGLPASLKASNLDPQGNATGTLTIQGTPLPGDAGLHMVQIMARNGVGATAQQTLMLNLVKLKGAAPVSGNQCDGAYTGTFQGDIGVSLGQNCMFVGGGVNGNVLVIGGELTLSKAKVTGNVRIQGSSAFSISPGSEINGDLTIEDVDLGMPRNALCSTRVGNDLFISNNVIPIVIGSPQTSCPGNVVGRNLVIKDNTDSIEVFDNQITRDLTCLRNILIAGGGNSAETKELQCVSF